MPVLPYIRSIVNMAAGFSQSLRPKNMGQLSDLLQDYRNSTDDPTVSGWKEYHVQKIGKDCIENATEKTWDFIERIKTNIEHLTKEDVRDWVEELVYDKTFSGLQIQLDVLRMVSKKSFRLATPTEESQGIDGYVDGNPVSIKPHTYKNSPASLNETIECDIIFYKKTRNGLVIV